MTMLFCFAESEIKVHNSVHTSLSIVQHDESFSSHFTVCDNVASNAALHSKNEEEEEEGGHCTYYTKRKQMTIYYTI